MKAIVVGGGKVGYYLSRTLLEHGHNPIIIEKHKEKCRRISDDLDIAVINGDGSSLEALTMAGADDADALISVTGTDEDNLIVCEIAKQVFKIPKTIARVNNPKNTGIMKMLGVDITVSSTASLAYLLEREVETAALQNIMSLNGGNTSLVEMRLPKNYPLHGQRVMDLPLPRESIIVSITRDGNMIIPKGDTLLLSGDKLLVVCNDDKMHTLVTSLKMDEKTYKEGRSYRF